MSTWEKNQAARADNHNSGKQRFFKPACHSVKPRIMKILIAGILLFIFSFFSCTKRLCACDPVVDITVKAVVADVSDISCGRPLLDIDPSDTALLNQVMGQSAIRYVANDLPAALKVNNQKLFVSVAVLYPSGDFACTAIGITYPHIKVLSARIRN